MVYLFTLFTSLCLQFGAVDFPIDIISQNAAHETFVQTVVSNYNSTYNKSIDYKRVIITRRNNSTYPYYLWIPIELYDPNTTSSITCNSRTDTYCSISNVGWIRYQVMANATVPTSTSPNTSSSIGNLYYSDQVNNNGLIYNGYYTLPINQVDTFIVEETIDYDDYWGIPLGSFSGIGGGHSQGGNAIEDIGDSSFIKNEHVPLSSSGHSVSVTPSTATYDFTNAEQNLLGQILNNTNSMLGHSSYISNQINVMSSNLITGATSLFNALSVINENIINNFTLQDEVLDEFWEDSNAKEIITGINDFESNVTDKIQDYTDTFEEGAQQKENNLTIDIDLTNWELPDTDYGDIKPFNRVYTMRFEFLDETKALWQPFLVGLLYFALITNLYFDFPNMLRGAVR